MSHFSMTVPHKLESEEALRRTRSLLDELTKQYASSITGLHEEWDGNVGKFQLVVMGQQITGTITVTGSGVDISGDLPFAAVFFRAQIEAAIRDRAATLLS